jgi:hypothetical protein
MGTDIEDKQEVGGQSSGEDKPRETSDSCPQESPVESRISRRAQLLLGALFGVGFGFLLQKGGVAKYEVLIGVLLLRDFTVIQVMVSAIVVGMLGVGLLHYLGLVKLSLKPTRYAANVLGGLIFGVGFALSAYCPGTGAAAVGQGNFDALAVVLGMLVGSYLFAEFSAWLNRTVGNWGDRGEVTLPELIGVRKWPFALGLGLLLVVGLLVLELAT